MRFKLLLIFSLSTYYTKAQTIATGIVIDQETNERPDPDLKRHFVENRPPGRLTEDLVNHEERQKSRHWIVASRLHFENRAQIPL